jgi:hypothetical protein
MSWDWRWFVVPGSALCVLPLAALLGAALWAQPGARAAVLRWWCALALAVLLAAGSKMAFYGWGTGVRAWDLTCFSGHTVLALCLWPVAMAVLVPPQHRRLRQWAVVAGVAFALLIAISRVKLRAHPVSEVVAGAMLGGGVAMIALHALRRHGLPPRVTAAGFAALLLGIVIYTLHGGRFPMLPTERWLARAGAALAGHDAPVDRRRWRDVSVLSPPAEIPLSR